MQEAIVADTIKQYIKEYLVNTGKKQAFLANELGYHPKTFSMLLNGRKPIRIDDIVIFCRYFKEPPNTFIRIDQAS